MTPAPPDNEYQSLDRLQRAKVHSRCQQCGSESLICINLLVPDEHHMKIGRLLGIDYSLGPGSGIQIPGRLCPRCGQVQIHHYPETQR